MRKFLFYCILCLGLIVFSGALSDLYAQCPMCRMSAESNLKDGGTAGIGLNAGILYMLITPYLLVGTMAWWWWRNKKRSKAADES